MMIRIFSTGGGSSINPLALLVAPLAAISLLAAAAAVAINPVLVQVAFTGKRKKRSSEDEAEWNPELNEKMHEMQVPNVLLLLKLNFPPLVVAKRNCNKNQSIKKKNGS